MSHVKESMDYDIRYLFCAGGISAASSLVNVHAVHSAHTHSDTQRARLHLECNVEHISRTSPISDQSFGDMPPSGNERKP
jgi:hypothetical protein